jgi:hypothetical protein
MQNKIELQNQANKLQKELDDLKILIDKTTNYTIEDIINSTTDQLALRISLEILGEPLTKLDRTFDDKQEQAFYYLKYIIKAVNFLDNNNQIWIPNFDDKNCKYYPWFNLSGGSLVLSVLFYYCSRSVVPVVLLYKNEKTAKSIVNKFINTLYKDYIKG